MRTGMNWDEWYYELCNVVGAKSQCLSRKIGSVLVMDKTIISTGYNGPPRGVQTCDERWLNDEKLQKAANFEENTNGFTTIEELYKMRLEGTCPRYAPEMGFKSGEGLDWCVAGHSERNAIINAARNGISTEGTILYMNCGTPCTPCLVEIINAGIKEIVITKEYYYDKSAEYLLKESGLKWRIYSHLKEK